MTREMTRPKCPECQKPLHHLPCSTRPASSEWYCPPPCHTSVPMAVEDAVALLEMEARQRPRTGK